MDELDLLAHGALIAAALWMIGPFWRARDRHPAGWPGVGLFVSVAGFALLRVFHDLEVRPFWTALAQALAVSGPFFFWRTVRTVFEDGFRPRLWHWGGLVVLEALALARLIWPDAPFGPALRAAAGALIAHALYLLLRGAGGDLVEARIRARGRILIVSALLALVTLSRPLLADAAPALAYALRRLTPIIDIVLMAAAAQHFFRFERALLPLSPPRPPEGGGADPDAADLARLDALMDQEAVWREPGLTVAALAARAGIPEYRLRRLIMERRGARNFSAFLAERRLAEAAARLADPKEAKWGIAAIAFDSGYASLGPFNRAFLARYGVTPSAYRRGERGQESTPNP